MLMCALLVLSPGVSAQNAPQSDSTSAHVVVADLSMPTYPALALQARIAGSVTLDVTVRANGNIESVTVVSGHPILANAASDSATHTRFECKDCNEALTHYPMTYKFELGDPTSCTGVDAEGKAQYQAHDPQVTQSQGTVTIVGRPVAICDPPASIVRVRSARCLFLWRCAKRYPS
jgi:TonB family protein